MPNVRWPGSLCLVATLLSGCAHGRPQDAREAVAAPAERGRSASAADRAPERVAAIADEPGETDGGPPSPAGQPADLLRGVSTAVAVSSVYRDSKRQAWALTDGDLETAWNSRTGDLVGAWIEVRVPDSAGVTSIEMTVGFTKRSSHGDGDERADLFTKNHRVSKVRVTRDGREIGVFGLDTSSRELQAMPVEGPGGVYRLEVVAVEPGTTARYREVCVSELRVMGHASEVDEGLRFPRFGVGALPPPLPAKGEVDPVAVAARLEGLLRWLSKEWGGVIRGQTTLDSSTGFDEGDRAAIGPLIEKRQDAFDRVADLVSVVDDARGGRLRYRAARRDGLGVSPWKVYLPDDQDVIADGIDVLVLELDDGDLRCRWAKLDVELRYELVLGRLASMNAQCGSPEPGPDWALECLSAGDARDRALRIQDVWRTDPRRASTRIVGSDLPGRRDRPFLHQALWTSLKQRTELARRACGWAAD